MHAATGSFNFGPADNIVQRPVAAFHQHIRHQCGNYLLRRLFVKDCDIINHLQAGQVVMPGSCTRAVPVGAGDQVRADLDGLGFVSTHFTKTDSVGSRRAREAVGA